MNYGKLILNLTFVFAITYGIISTRYLLHAIFPQLSMSSLWLLNYDYFYTPLLNKITFLMHSSGGILSLALGPFVLQAIKNHWQCKHAVIMAYFCFAVLPMAWPIVFLVESHGISISYFLVLTIEVTWIFMLIKAILYYHKRNMSSFLIFFIYHYCISAGALFWRLLRLLIQAIVTHIPAESVPVIPMSQPFHTIQLNPAFLWYDVTWFLAFVLSVGLAKILIYTKVISQYYQDEEE